MNRKEQTEREKFESDKQITDFNLIIPTRNARSSSILNVERQFDFPCDSRKSFVRNWFKAANKDIDLQPFSTILLSNICLKETEITVIPKRLIRVVDVR